VRREREGDASGTDRELERLAAADQFGEERRGVVLVAALVLVVASRDLRPEAASGIESVHAVTLPARGARSQ